MNTPATTPELALKEACRRAGNQTELARLLNRKKAAVSRWLSERVPAEVCPEIEKLTGVLCEELRPDVNWSVLRAGYASPDVKTNSPKVASRSLKARA